MTSAYEKLYNRGPIWLQNVFTSAWGYKLYRQRYGSAYRRHFDQLMVKDYSCLESELRNQECEMIRLITHAAQHSVFYQRFYSDIDLSSIRTVDDLKKLPVLEKETLRANIEDVYTIRPHHGVKGFTGGTTGKALMVIYREEDMQMRMAYLDAFKARLGVVNGMRRATFSGKQIIPQRQKAKVFWRYNRALRQRLYSTFHMTTENLAYYISDLNNFKPETINGFVSALFDLAQYIRESGITLTFRPIAIFTTSETLLPIHRAVIEAVFSCPVYDQYASAEGATFVTECMHRNLHYNLDTGIIEPFETSQGTEMLVTSFTTYGTPLIRYRIGDLIEFGAGQCACGSCHPIVKRIEGRAVDYLVSKERGKVSLSHLADVIKGFPNGIINMQFVQKSYEEIQIHMVVDPLSYKEHYGQIIVEQMIYRFGANMTFPLIRVPTIQREKSGKHRLIRNLVDQEGGK